MSFATQSDYKRAVSINGAYLYKLEEEKKENEFEKKYHAHMSAWDKKYGGLKDNYVKE